MLSELATAQGMLKYLYVHVKEHLEALDETGLNWTPPGIEATNSVYGLALHIAQTQVLFASKLSGQKLRLDIPELEKDGSALKLHGISPEQAVSLLRQAAAIVNEVFEAATPEQLEIPTTLPGGSASIGHSWAHLLIMHTAEHYGHIALTHQLYQQYQQNNKA
jgi:hypothetical protein